MIYSVFLTPKAEKELKELQKIDKKIYAKVYLTIDLLSEHPRPMGCLKLTGKNGYRIRIGRYRLLYEINDDAKSIIIHRLQHRKDVYR